ncbi:MAG TPA: polysaccharide deacetylase family protein [Myxococcota bacterium]|nr:polysaccharide deacetylase family protein [Myxococcota bacterium]
MGLALVVLAALLAAGGAAFWIARRGEDRPDRILGLLYHRLVSEAEYASCPPTEKIFSMTEARFREQMEYLKREGYHPVSLDAVLDFVERGTPLPHRPVSITFDDGCVSVHDRALPILRELGIPAVLFVTTDPDAWCFALGSNSQRRVTPEEMRALEAGGVAIGSHALTHGALESMDDAGIRKELGESKRWLEGHLGHPVDSFAVPLNWYGPRVKRIAKELGYRSVMTSDNGTIHRDSDPFHLRRFIIEGSFDVQEFARNLTATSIVQRRVINFVKRAPARLLGPRIWLPFRRWLFATPLGRYFTLRYMKRIVAAGALGLVALVIALVWAAAGS